MCVFIDRGVQNGGRTSTSLGDDQHPQLGDSPSDSKLLHGARYKKVAIVEDFFDIIYNVHVEMDGRGGKHAGQKRTYRAVSIIYAAVLLVVVTRI